MEKNPKIKLETEKLFFKPLDPKMAVLYNDDEEIMAVAKLGVPLKKSTITDLFINVKFDID